MSVGTIWMLPKTNNTNKYNELLSTSLEKQGLRVENGSKKNFLRMRRGDVIHFHWIGGYYQGSKKIIMYLKFLMFISFLSYIKLRGVKIVWTVHNLYPHKYKWIELEKKFRRKIMFKCDKLIVAAYSIKEKLVNEFNVNPNLVSVVFHGHYDNVYPIQNRNYRLKYNISDNDIVFLFVGALKEYKGISELLDAFSKLNDKNVHLIIAGKPYDNMDKEVQKYKKNRNITFDLRFIPDEELCDLILSSDYVVLPYKNITTSGTAILAVSLKRKIICPKTPFMEEYFNDYTAVMYDSKNGEQLIDKLKTCASSLGNKLIPINEFEQFTLKLDWIEVAKKIERIYLSL